VQPGDLVVIARICRSTRANSSLRPSWAA
jgi:hypothetical protein